MNIKGLKLFALFIFSITITMAFQNCGKSTAKNSSSNNNGGLQVQVDPGINGDGSGDGTGGDGTGGDGTGGDGSGGPTGDPNEFSFDMNRGDSILYSDGGGISPNLRSLRILQKSFYVIAESNIYIPAGQMRSPDLDMNYCQNSAFPHCTHLNTMVCMGEGCPTNRPIACHWETRMSQADINNAFSAINNLVFLSKIANSSEPFAADCDNPNLFFYSDVAEDVNVSLASSQCVPEGKYYASRGGDNLAAIFNAELDSVENAGDACNNYASYNWQRTKWTYVANSGFTTQEMSSFRNVSYDNGMTSLRWKNSGDMTTYCADNVPMIAQDSNNNLLWDYMDEFFPADGLVYTIFVPNARVADAPTARITYEDSMDNGAVREFYLNNMSATSFNGGAVLESNAAQTITNTVELLIQRADQYGYTSTNCN